MKKIILSSLVIWFIITSFSCLSFATEEEILQENNEITINITNETNEENFENIESVKDKKVEAKFIEGAWRAVIDGKIDYTYTGLAENSNGQWYIKDGTIKFDYTGTYIENDVYYIIEENKVYVTASKDTTGLVYVKDAWKMVKNGYVDYTYTGIGTNEKGTWALKNGKVQFNFSGNYKCSTGTYVVEDGKVRTDYTKLMHIEGSWKMVVEGKVDYNYTGIGKNINGTWYIENGKIDFKYTGTYFEKNNAYIIEESRVYATVSANTTSLVYVKNAWKMVKNGYVDYTYTGIGTNVNGTWIVKNGKVDFSINGAYKLGTTTYIVDGGKVRTDYTKLMKIEGSWKMVIKGIIDYTYTGIGTNLNGTWYIENGVIDFKYTGTYFEGNKAYIVEKSKVYAEVAKNATEVIKVNNVWRMVVNGKVDYNYNGIGTNSNGTWYVKDGTINFNYTGIYKNEQGAYIVDKNKIRTDYTKLMYVENAWRMIISGKIEYNYTGIGSNENGVWYIENGKIDFSYTGTYFEGDKAYLIEKNKVYNEVKKDTTEIVKVNGIWRMVIDGKVDYTYTGRGENANGMFLVENGIITLNYTGTYTDETGTYIVEKSKVRTDYTKLVYVEGSWKMVIKGKIDYHYSGIGSNENGTWLVEDGIITFKYTGTYYEGSKGYIVEESKVYATVTKTTKGLYYVNGKWRMVTNGEVDYHYEGLGENQNGTWLFKDGVVNFSFTGEWKDKDGSRYTFVNGKLRTVLERAGYPATMKIEEPVQGNKYISDNISIVGWALSEEKNDTIAIYVDDKYVGKAQRVAREDVFNVYKDQFGGRVSTPKPGYEFNLRSLELSVGKHRITVVNLASDNKTIMQSREAEFTITSLTKTWGIDVSRYQGVIDWNTVKNSGVQYAILRVGYYLDSQNRVILDDYFERNYTECRRLGIAIGGYFYSYAFNPEEAAREASACLSLINGKRFELPIFIDVEDKVIINAVNSGKTNKETLTNACITFCDMMNNSGFQGGVYASKNFYNTYLNAPVLERYHIWLAHYTSETDYAGRYDLWQYTSSGMIPGITGNVDLNWCFRRY